MSTVAHSGFQHKLAQARLGPIRYNSPMFQVVLVGITTFCTVGMFSALTNLGAGGSQAVGLVDTTNAVLYALFAVTGLVAGGINNILGPRLTLFIGTWGYMLYVGGLWCHQTTGNHGFLIASGAILGVCAALLWSAQGAIMMAYPLEKDKGKAFAYFWAIFQLGAVMGASITLGENIHSSLGAVRTGTYLAFVIIIAVGCFSSFLILPPNYIIRSDKTLVKLEAKSSVTTEIRGIISTLKDWRMVALLPMFFASNYFYAYQGAVNAAYFNARTRSLNALLEGFGAIFGALVIGNFCLDLTIIGNRRTRGFVALGLVTAIVIAVWVPALVWQTSFNRADAKSPTWVLLDFTDSEYPKRGALYFFYYFGDAMYQALAYWIMAALTNDPWQLARFAGLYKALQSAGAAGSFGMDAVATPYLNEHLASWIMMLVSFPLAGWVIYGITDSNYASEKTLVVDDTNIDHIDAALHNHHEVEEQGEKQESLDEKAAV